MQTAAIKPLDVVTGASSGIGRELAARFAENGYDLVVAAEDKRIESVARSFAEALRYEVRDTGVTVTALMPGPTDTEFFDRAGMHGTKLREQTAKDNPADVAREGFEALMAGKDHVVAGSVKNKVQAAAGRVMPETAKAATQAHQTEPGGGA